jgi:hypothetical protein
MQRMKKHGEPARFRVIVPRQQKYPRELGSMSLPGAASLPS